MTKFFLGIFNIEKSDHSNFFVHWRCLKNSGKYEIQLLKFYSFMEAISFNYSIKLFSIVNFHFTIEIFFSKMRKRADDEDEKEVRKKNFWLKIDLTPMQCANEWHTYHTKLLLVFEREKTILYIIHIII